MDPFSTPSTRHVRLAEGLSPQAGLCVRPLPPVLNPYQQEKDMRSTETVLGEMKACLPSVRRSRRALTLGVLLAAVAYPSAVLATANYVYHERSGSDVTGGAPNTCAGAQAYVPTLNPSSAQTYLLRFKVEYQFFTDTLKVYYTIDGSNPSGAQGVASGTTQVINGSYQCTFTFGGNTIDVCNATIPAQPAGTVVKYIISAYHSGGGPEIFANSGTCGGCGDCEMSSCATIFQYTVGSTTALYWDINGATAGAGGATPTGTWDGATANWSTVFDGTAATGVWVSGRNAVFSAGTDASAAYTVTVSGTQTVGGISVEEGTVTLATGTASIGAGPITIGAGATLSTDSSLRIAATAGSTMTINGGTARSTNPSSAGSFVDVDQVIVLGPGGGTLSYTVAGVLNIVQTTTTISGTGPLTKEGAGILAIASPCTYSGATIINDGTLRVRTSSNRLPITTDVVVNSPGALDPGSTGNNIQQVNTINGNGNVTFSASSTLLITGDGNSSLSGVISDGTAFGRISKQGAGTLTLSGVNTYDGRFTNDAGTTTITPGAAWCGTVCDVYINGGSVNLNNAAQTIENLVGAGGVINLGAGHMLTINPVSSSTYSGTLAGPGGVTKTGTSLEIFSGPNTYDGTTFINGGRLQVGSATALGSTVGGTEVASGAELLFDGAATTFTINEPLKIAGPGGSDNGAIAVQNSANVTISGPVSLTGDATNTVSSTATVLYDNPNAFTSLADQNLTLQGGSGAGGGGTISGVIALGAGGLTKLQTGAWVLSGNNTYGGPTIVSAGTLVAAANNAMGASSGSTTVSNGASLAFRGGINYSTPEPLIVAGQGRLGFGAISNDSGNNVFAGPITIYSNTVVGGSTGTSLQLSGVIGETDGSWALTKFTPCTIILSAANTYSGGTIISNGSLRVVNTTGSATGPGPVTIYSPGILSGPGTVAGTVTVNGTISPGSSPGTLTTGSEIWNSGGSYLWEINSTDGAEGVRASGWDLLDINGSLRIEASPASPFVIRITSLTPENVPGATSAFDWNAEYTWRIAKTTGGISGFDPAAVVLDTSGFTQPLGHGAFVLETANGGNDLVLRFVPGPLLTAQPINRPAREKKKLAGRVETSAARIFRQPTLSGQIL
jgi:autotransporter-associated beta strand protein